MKKKNKNLLDNPSLKAQWLLSGVPRHCWDLDTVMPSDLIAKGRAPEKYTDAGADTFEITTILDECKELRK